MDQTKQRLLELIKLKKAFRREPVILASGRASDYYFNGKQITLDPEGLFLVAKLVLAELRPGEVTAIGGPTLGADPIAAAASVLSWQEGWRPALKAFIVRKQPKGHGLKKVIEGDLAAGESVVVVEDTITTGGSIKTAIDRIEETGAKVAKIICLLDRQEGAAEALAGYQIVSLLSREEIWNS